MKNKVDLALMILLVILAGTLGAVIVNSMREHVVEVGDSAPSFNITTDQGRQISPTNFGGKVLVLNFWATWCEPCVEETPALNQFARQTASSGVVVLGVSVDRNPKLYEQFRRRFQVAFQTYRDPDMNISADFGTYKYPETYIIDRSGKVVRKVISDYNWMDPDMIHFVESL